jgi:hypothetical protein
MAEINYATLVAGLIKPLVTHPEEVTCKVTSASATEVKVLAVVNKEDLGRVIGKKGRVAGAIRTLAHAAAIRNKQDIEIEFNASEE